jgi:hypothetical protein
MKQTYGLIFANGDILAPSGYLDLDEHPEDVEGWTREDATTQLYDYADGSGQDVALTKLAEVEE